MIIFLPFTLPWTNYTPPPSHIWLPSLSSPLVSHSTHESHDTIYQCQHMGQPEREIQNPAITQGLNISMLYA